MRGLLAVALVVVACGSGGAPAATAPGVAPAPPQVAATLGTRDQILRDFGRAHGFTGSESPLADGTPRWVGRGPGGALLEVGGPPHAVQRLSLVVAAGSGDAGSITGVLLGRYAPGLTDFFREALERAKTSDVDTERTVGNRRLRVQTLRMADDVLVTVTVEAV